MLGFDQSYSEATIYPKCEDTIELGGDNWHQWHIWKKMRFRFYCSSLECFNNYLNNFVENKIPEWAPFLRSLPHFIVAILIFSNESSTNLKMELSDFEKFSIQKFSIHLLMLFATLMLSFKV